VLEFDFLKQCAWTSDLRRNCPITIFFQFSSLRAGICAFPLSICFRCLWSGNYL